MKWANLRAHLLATLSPLVSASRHACGARVRLRGRGPGERVRRNGRRVAASMPHTQANGLLPPGPSTISFVAAVVVSVRSPCPPVSVRPRPSLLASPLSVDR